VGALLCEKGAWVAWYRFTVRPQLKSSLLTGRGVNGGCLAVGRSSSVDSFRLAVWDVYGSV